MKAVLREAWNDRVVRWWSWRIIQTMVFVLAVNEGLGRGSW